MSFWKWSRTAANNATVDGSINWAEGQAPSTVNDSARAMMAAAAKYRDDISGAIVTAGSSTAYTLSTYQLFDSLVHLDGAMVAFTPANVVTINAVAVSANHDYIALSVTAAVDTSNGETTGIHSVPIAITVTQNSKAGPVSAMDTGHLTLLYHDELTALPGSNTALYSRITLAATTINPKQMPDPRVALHAVSSI